MKSFNKDGCDIIDEFIKHKSSYFPKKNTELVGIEIGLNEGLDKNIEFRGYMDVVIHNKTTGRIKILDIKKLFEYANTCKIPKFPISGNDLRQHGFKSGLELGAKLKSLEEKWIENNFVIDKKTVEKSLRKINGN